MAAKPISLNLSVICLSSQIHVAMQIFCGPSLIPLKISPFLFYAVKRTKMYILTSCQVLFSLKIIIYHFISVNDNGIV